MAENNRNEGTPNGEDLRIKTPATSSNYARDTVRGNLEDIVACLNEAKKAQEIATQDLEKASNWLNKSQELLAKVLAEIAAGDQPKETPSVNPKAFPADVDNNSVVDQNREQTRTRTSTDQQSGPNHDQTVGAKTFIDKAIKAFKAGNIDKAERLFLKAMRMDASIDVEQYLKDVRDARARNTTSSDSSVTEESPRKPERTEQTNSIVEEAATYLQVAENAFKDNKYERALIFLDKSEALYASERVVKLRKQVQDATSKPTNSLFVNDASYTSATSENPSKPSRGQKLDELITAIQNDIDAGDFEEAERKLQMPELVGCKQLEKLKEELKEKKILEQEKKKVTSLPWPTLTPIRPLPYWNFF